MVAPVYVPQGGVAGGRLFAVRGFPIDCVPLSVLSFSLLPICFSDGSPHNPQTRSPVKCWTGFPVIAWQSPGDRILSQSFSGSF